MTQELWGWQAKLKEDMAAIAELKKNITPEQLAIDNTQLEDMFFDYYQLIRVLARKEELAKK